MIDLTLFRAILEEKQGFITDEDELSYEIIEFLANPEWKIEKVKSLFCKNLPTNKFNCELLCQKCEARFWKILSKSKTLAYITYRLYQKSNYQSKSYEITRIEADLWCDKCRQERKIQAQAAQREQKQTQQELIEQQQKSFIESYLSPGNVWKEDIRQSQRFTILSQESMFLDREEIAKYINLLTYADFLRTPYWNAVAIKVRRHAGYKCQVCGRKDKSLNVHHNTYDHHGYELKYWKTDLICLCEDCHSTYHISK